MVKDGEDWHGLQSTNLKSLAKLFKRDWAPLSAKCFTWCLDCRFYLVAGHTGCCYGRLSHWVNILIILMFIDLFRTVWLLIEVLHRNCPLSTPCCKLLCLKFSEFFSWWSWVLAISSTKYLQFWRFSFVPNLGCWEIELCSFQTWNSSFKWSLIDFCWSYCVILIVCYASRHEFSSSQPKYNGSAKRKLDNSSEILIFVIPGANPYPGMTRDQVIGQLHIGYRMPKPQYCTDEL